MQRLSVVLLALLVACGPGLDPRQATVEQKSIEVPPFPSRVTTGAGSVWVIHRGDSLLTEIDPKTDEVVGTQVLSHSRRELLSDVAFGAGRVWVISPVRKLIYEVDPDTGKVDTIDTGSRASDVYLAGGSLWYHGSNGLRRVDPRSHRTIATWDVGPINSHVSGVVSVGGSIWVLRDHARHRSGTGPHATWFLTAQLWEIDPASNKIVSKQGIGSTLMREADPVVGTITAFDGSVWLSMNHERALLRLDPGRRKVLSRTDVSELELPWKFAMAGGAAWIADLNEGEMLKIDLETGEREPFTVDGETSAFTAGFGSVWIPLPDPDDPWAENGSVIRVR